MTLHVAHTGRKVAKKPCKECPFRKGSAKGWLGGHAADDYVQAAHGENHIPCHMSKGYRSHETADLKPCAGLALYRNNVMKSPRGGQPREACDRLENSPHADEVFASSADFLAHHRDHPFAQIVQARTTGDDDE